MFKYMKLEIKRNNLKPYITAVVIMFFVIIGMLYLFAAIPKMDPTESDLDMFKSYDSITTLTCLLDMVCFAILSSVMYAKFVVEDYAGKRALLLFSYPVSRKKIFISKVNVVFLFTFLSMAINGILCFGIFYLTESFLSICDDTVTIQVIIKSMVLIIIYSVMAGALGSTSLWFGLWKKSIPATIVSGTLIATIVCQFLAIGMNNVIVVIGFTIISIIVAVLLLMESSQKINTLEV